MGTVHQTMDRKLSLRRKASTVDTTSHSVVQLSSLLSIVPPYRFPVEII